ncbi:hypothetical protein H5J25_11595 [Sphingomonas aliaeris]|uniref:Uncharacterized protein n=1 Tax=Sphingomonas aliaeris TaxID=2759526 RepID=A0A974S337_9SPHN|nr:hypothetical protein [Sphingomonas aliaeris]QQV76167.1 hypothetical protein H5J25_11595 [Sphingomonas aliaeris]
MKRTFLFPAGMMLCFPTPSLAATKPSLDGEKVLADFARCAVREAPQQSRRVIESMPESADEQTQIDRLFQKHSKCMRLGTSIQSAGLAASVNLGQTSLGAAAAQMANDRRQMIFSRRALRGAIVTRLYLGSGETSGTASQNFASVDRADRLLPVGYVVVRCAVDREPLAADRLVRAKRMSVAESDAGRALAPALNACGRGKGRVDISGTAIHGWAAEALYKRRHPVATAESN